MVTCEMIVLQKFWCFISHVATNETEIKVDVAVKDVFTCNQSKKSLEGFQNFLAAKTLFLFQMWLHVKKTLKCCQNFFLSHVTTASGRA